MSLKKVAQSLPFSGLIRKLEHEVETVVNVLSPGPLGIVEHKFSEVEIQNAKASVQRALVNWRRRAKMEKRTGILKDYME